MKKFIEGDIVTVEDIHAILQEVKYNLQGCGDSNVKYRIDRGVKVFDSEEDAERYYGGFLTVEEVFGNPMK